MSEPAFRLADYLRARLLKAKPDHTIGRGPHDESKWESSKRRRTWGSEFDRFLKASGRAPEQLRDVIYWLFHGNLDSSKPFRVESPSSLRDKLDRIETAMAGHRPRTEQQPDNLLEGYTVSG